jgi:hypothetical protein
MKVEIDFSQNGITPKKLTRQVSRYSEKKMGQYLTQKVNDIERQAELDDLNSMAKTLVDKTASQLTSKMTMKVNQALSSTSFLKKESIQEELKLDCNLFLID